MANPFSFSQGAFFKRETATLLNQEARILDFVAHSLASNNLCMRAPFIFVHYAHAFHILYHVASGKFQNFCLYIIYIYSPRISIDMNTQWARFTRQLLGCALIAHKGERSPFYSTHHSHAQHTLLHCQEEEYQTSTKPLFPHLP